MIPKCIARISVKLGLSLCLSLFIVPAFAQKRVKGAVAPVTVSGLDNELYVGYEHVSLDYALQTSSGTARVSTNGLNLQYAYRERDHLMFVGSARFGIGNPLGVKNAVVGGGIGYVADWRHYQGFAQSLIGYSRLSSSSPDGIYLSTTPKYGFTTMTGAGLDVNLGDRFGVRPIYVENQFLPFGSRRSVDWSISSGFLVRFHGPYGRRY